MGAVGGRIGWIVTRSGTARRPGIPGTTKGVRAAKSDLRITMMNMIWDTGLRITSSDDLIGLPTIGEDSPDF